MVHDKKNHPVELVYYIIIIIVYYGFHDIARRV